MGAESDLIFVAAFRCAHCQAGLESRADQPRAWVRCPKCGRASRAPDPVVTRPPAPRSPGDDVHRIAAAPEPRPMTPVAVALPAARPEPLAEDFGSLTEVPGGADGPVSPWRVACGAGLFVSVTGLLFSLLEQAELGIIGFSVGAVLMAIVLVRTAAS